MFEKLKNTGWLLPVWWLAVLYVWFGSVYPFLFGSHEPGGKIAPVGLWLSVVYGVVLVFGILLFRDRPLFRWFFVSCRILQILASLILILDFHWGVSAVSALLIIPYIGLLQYNNIWLYILLILLNLALTLLAVLISKQNSPSRENH